MNYSRQESHRVYLQRYLPPASSGISPFSSTNPTGNNGEGHRLVTSSAAIRLTDAATAFNVTCLLRKKFGLSSLPVSSDFTVKSLQRGNQIANTQTNTQKKSKNRYFKGDALIIVGTLHNLPRQHLEYDHEEGHHLHLNNIIQRKDTLAKPHEDKVSTTKNTTISHNPSLSSINTNSLQNEAIDKNRYSNTETQTEGKTENINVIHTLLPHENPLLVRDEMLAHLHNRQHEFDTSYRSNHILKKVNLSNKNTQSNQRLKKVEQMLQRQRNKKDDSHIKNKHRNSVNVSINWFFQPNGGGMCDTSKEKLLENNDENQNAIPTLLNLDGYISACEDSDSDDNFECECDSTPQCNLDEQIYADANKSSEWNYDSSYSNKYATAPRITMHLHLPTTVNQESKEILHYEDFQKTVPRSQHYLWKTMKNRSTLAQLRHPTSNSHSVSGYLLKRSSHDPNVWRKMYCTLSDDHFWFVSRIKPIPNFSNQNEYHSNSNKNNHKHRNKILRTSKHHVIHLSQASVCDPLKDQPEAKSRLSFNSPIHLIEICSDNGNVHTFCAPHHKAQLFWIESISTRICTCSENKFMEFAELIVEEEEHARVDRMNEHSLINCWKHMHEPTCVDEKISNHESTYSNTNTMSKEEQNGDCGQVISITKNWCKDLIQFSVLVQEYREVCRHFVSFGRCFSGVVDEINRKEVESWRFGIRMQWEAAAIVCKSRYYLNISMSIEEPNQDSKFYSDDGGQLGEICASIEAFVSNNIERLNSKYAKDIVLIEAPPIDLFDAIMKKVFLCDYVNNMQTHIESSVETEKIAQNLNK